LPEEAAIAREQVRFASGDSDCAAVLMRPERARADAPCVVLAHGFGALKEGGPIRTGERFAAAGYAALAFDYRHFGESGGEPRQLLDIRRQHADWHAAVDFARALDGVDPARVAVWGSSFGGGHVIHVAASDTTIAAAIAQVPYADGLACLRVVGPAGNVRLFAGAVADLASAAARRPPHMTAIVGPPGSTAFMSTPDAEPGYAAIYDEGFEWRNEVAGRAALRVGLYRPGREAARVRCPLLVQVAGDDAITPVEPAAAAARRAPRGELVTYPGIGHFDVYRGERFELAVADQLEFLARHLPVHA
jgi:uncharacterized protein